ncbi:unnamed protein product [Paramecium sonneborni]|uniref:Uncharacterized protein n=1 Tax=Paramecium sonneborni TaxID=65129 RepID=A0A8S1N4N0_9CILI|nr:unnamed protein product [Paramecium sonneborni]
MNTNSIITLTIEQLVQLLLSPQLPNIQQSLQSLSEIEIRKNYPELKKLISFNIQEQQNHNNSSSDQNTSSKMRNKINVLQQENDKLKNQLEQHFISENKLIQQLNQCQLQSEKLKLDNQQLKQKMNNIQINIKNKKLIKHKVETSPIYQEQKKPKAVRPLQFDQPLLKFSGISGIVTQCPFGNSKRQFNDLQTARSEQK